MLNKLNKKMIVPIVSLMVIGISGYGVLANKPSTNLEQQRDNVGITITEIADQPATTAEASVAPISTETATSPSIEPETLTNSPTVAETVINPLVQPSQPTQTPAPKRIIDVKTDQRATADPKVSDTYCINIYDDGSTSEYFTGQSKGSMTISCG